MEKKQCTSAPVVKIPSVCQITNFPLRSDLKGIYISFCVEYIFQLIIPNSMTRTDTPEPSENFSIWLIPSKTVRAPYLLEEKYIAHTIQPNIYLSHNQSCLEILLSQFGATSATEVLKDHCAICRWRFQPRVNNSTRFFKHCHHAPLTILTDLNNAWERETKITVNSQWYYATGLDKFFTVPDAMECRW